MMNRRRYVILILCALGVALAGWQWRQGAQPPTVMVAAARSAPLVVEWSAVGYVEAYTAQVTAPQVGRVLRVTVREGDTVRAGQALASLESRAEEAGLTVQQEGVRVAVAQADSAQAALRETEQTQKDRVARAEAEVTAARARQRQAETSLTRARKVLNANLAAARAATLAARADLADLQQGSRPEEILQAQADLSASEAVAARAKVEAARQTQLFREGAAARSAVEDAQEALQRAEAAVQARRAALALLQKGTRAEQINAARARLRAAEAQAAAAEGELTTLDTEKKKVEEAQAALRASRASLAETRSARLHQETLRQEARAAQTRIRQSEASVDQARAAVVERVLTAPFAGVIGRRFVDPGDMASPAQPLFSVVAAGDAWVAAEVDEQDLAPVREGQEVTLTSPAYAGREFVGKVTRIGGEAVPQTEVRTGARIVRVRISLGLIPPDERRRLKPGMEVHVAGRATLVPQAVLVPSDALLTDNQGTYLFVADGGVARARRVRAGYVNGRETEIVEGLQSGERVVISGKEGLREGSRVTPQESS